MKIRTGFVSNSSSSSFICDVTGEIESGMDMSYTDAEMSCCERGHTFSNYLAVCSIKNLSDETKIRLVAENNIDFEDSQEKSYELRKEEKKEKELLFINENGAAELVRRFDDDEDYNEEIQNGYNIPSEMCPICMFKELSLDDVKAFLYRKLNMTKKEVVEDIKSQFDNYDEFKAYLTEKE
ncbi:MAG: hypothetical protein DRJ01_01025 [Bacteroidetes bacterium]|nr:MAG: hypothetical protein DRJ01_01025 [Bacteroidota bacterium]